MIQKILIFTFVILTVLFFVKNPDIGNKFIKFSTNTIGSGISSITGNAVVNLTNNNMTTSNLTITNTTLLNITNSS